MTGLDEFFFKLPEPQRSCFLAMRQLAASFHPDLAETLKYGAPCFVLGGKPFCYLWKDRKTDHPYFLMVDGKHLDHPKLEAGDRKKMKILRVDPNKDLEVEVITEVLSSAIQLRLGNHS